MGRTTQLLCLHAVLSIATALQPLNNEDNKKKTIGCLHHACGNLVGTYKTLPEELGIMKPLVWKQFLVEPLSLFCFFFSFLDWENPEFAIHLMMGLTDRRKTFSLFDSRLSAAPTAMEGDVRWACAIGTINVIKVCLHMVKFDIMKWKRKVDLVANRMSRKTGSSALQIWKVLLMFHVIIFRSTMISFRYT